jgi:glycosyl transferase family 87
MSWVFRALIGIGVLGLAARFVLALLSEGCNDVAIWFDHARVILDHGLRHAYEQPPPSGTRPAIYNHPPLPGYWSALSLALARNDLHRFSIWLKVPGLLVEVLSGALVYRIASKHGRIAGARAFAAYGLSFVAILVAGYHGNTDSVYAGLTLLAAYLLDEKEAPFWAGATLALALNVKLLSVFVVPPLAAQCRSRRAAMSFAAGIALAIVPFVPLLVTSHQALVKNLLSYNSLNDEWGLNAFFDYGAASGSVAPLAKALSAAYLPKGRYVVLLAVGLLSIVAFFERRWTSYELGALAWALFLILTPGFGVQYTVCIVPLLFAANVKRAMSYSTFAGMFIGIIYVSVLSWKLPLRADIQIPFQPVAVLFGVLAWAGLVRFVDVTFVKRCKGSYYPD